MTALDRAAGLTGPRIGELFAGAGGIGMGLKAIWPDASVSWVSDIKPGACKVLAHRFPDAPNLGDITKIDWSQVEPVDIITGGSPCQDLSHAGKRAGMKPGTRSGLWASMHDAIDILRPSLVVWENVRGALSATATTGDLEQCEFCMDDDGAGTMRALGRVLGDLADIGYDAGWVGLRAADVGAPHGRFRVFVLAWPANTEREHCNQWRHAAPRQATSGWASAVDSGRGGAPVDPILGTPRATKSGMAASRVQVQRGEHKSRLEAQIALLRTPMADEDGGGPLHPDTARERGQTLRLTGQILAMTGDLLPTPAVNDMGAGKTVEHWDTWTEAMKAKHGNGNGHGKSLHIEAQRLAVGESGNLLPTPTSGDSVGTGYATEWGELTDADGRHRLRDAANLHALHATWGVYAPAIARWESVMGRPAPSPTEPTGKNGANRLSGRFTEFMMGWPAGWVTDTPEVTRNEALSICGDGVVPQQAEAAVRHLLGARTTALAKTSECAS